MKKLHIAYFSIPALADCDVPLLKEMRKWADVDYYLPMTGQRCQSVLFDVQVKQSCGLYSAKGYQELAFLNDWIPTKNVFILNMPAPHDYSPGNLKVMWQCVRQMKREDYDLIHVTWPFRYGFFPLYVLRKKMVLTMHDPIPHSGDYTRANLMNRWIAFKLIKHFILLNKNQRKEFSERYHIADDRIFQSHLSVYTHLTKIPVGAPLCPKPYVLFFGSINVNKGIEYLCHAMQKVLVQRPELHVMIAGKGTFYFDVFPYKDNPNFHFINRFITDEEQVSLITHSEAVICPYVDATQSGVVMSAFALNKPVIATNVGGLPEMIESGRHGILVEPRDIKGLAKAIIATADQSLMKEMSEHIKDDFQMGGKSWEAIALEIKDIYSKLIGH